MTILLDAVNVASLANMGAAFAAVIAVFAAAMDIVEQMKVAGMTDIDAFDSLYECVGSTRRLLCS